MNETHIPFSAVVLYFDGTNIDDEDTRNCAKSIYEALVKRGHKTKKVIVTEENWREAITIPGDIVFNLVEDETWELYNKVAHGLEEHHRAEVAHDKNCFVYVTSKAAIKKALQDHAIRTPSSVIITEETDLSKEFPLRYPCIVKPSDQHAGIGISQESVVKNHDALIKRIEFVRSRYAGNVVVEEYIAGREIHVTVIGNGDTMTVLPCCEIGFGGKFQKNWSVYTYEAKWDKKSWEYWDARIDAPAKIPDATRNEIETMAKKTYTTLSCRDIARLDFRVDADNTPFVVDVNINPSLNYYDEQDATLASVYALKWSYDQFIEMLGEITYKRCFGDHLPAALP